MKIRVFQRANRVHYQAEWEDPVTGKRCNRSTGATTRDAALRFAAKLEMELESGGQINQRISWQEVREQYELDVFPSRSDGTAKKMRTTFNMIERIIRPVRISGLHEEQCQAFARALRRLGRAELTVRSHLSNLQALLNWAARQKLLETVPHVEKPPNVSIQMKGRAPTAEEFDRMLAAVPRIVGPDLAARWEHLLRGLWLSGLRLEESTLLHWTDDSRLMVDLSGRKPMFRIQPRGEKGRKFRPLPMTRDFYRFLMETPEQNRRGFVFDPVDPLTGDRPKLQQVSEYISAIGEQAGVKVAEKEKRGPDGKVRTVIKYASAHDLRRAFGLRWSRKGCRAPLLMLLMRHADIKTTLQYYIGQDAEAAADEIWDLDEFTDKSTDTTGKKTRRKNRETPQVDVDNDFTNLPR